MGFGLAVSLGNTIAAGIVRTPGEIAAGVKDPWLFISVWVCGGLYALLGANYLAELGTAIPRSAGQYAFSRRALGEYAGFVVGWSDWLSTCGTTALVAFVASEYLGALLPALRGRTVALALLLTLSFALLQWRGLRWGSLTQDLMSLLKALALLALVGACFVLGGGQRWEAAPAQSPVGSAGLMAALFLALQSVIYTYDGWSGPLYFSEEIRETGRNLPRALLWGVLAIILIYLLVNLAILWVLPLSRIAGDDFAIGSAAAAVLGPRGESVARAVMVLSMLAGLNAYHLMASRVVHAMARDGLFFEAAAAVNPGGTPPVSLWLSAGVAALFISFSSTFQGLLNALSFFFVANYAMSFLSLFVLRRREPDLPRPFRAWGHPFTTGLALCGSLAFLGAALALDLRSPQRSSIGALGLLAASYPAFRFLSRRRRGRS